MGVQFLRYWRPGNVFNNRDYFRTHRRHVDHLRKTFSPKIKAYQLYVIKSIDINQLFDRFSKMNAFKNRFLIIASFALIYLPQAIFACDKCFGGAAVNTPVTRGIGFSMLLLLIVVMCVLSLFIAFFINMWRRIRLFEAGKLVVTEQGNIINHPGVLYNIRNSTTQ